jgi:hypothetical protein
MVIQVGKTLQTISGASNTLTNLAFRFLFDDYSAFIAACSGYDATTASSTPALNKYVIYNGQKVYCGVEMASIVKKLLTTSVTSSSLSQYNTPKVAGN